MPSSGILRRVALVTTEVSEEPSLMEVLGSSETSIPKRATRYNFPEDGILNLLFVFVRFF
jgi:hypothetical protein